MAEIVVRGNSGSRMPARTWMVAHPHDAAALDPTLERFCYEAQNDLYRFALMLVDGRVHDAEDLVQETFLALMRNWRRARDHPHQYARITLRNAFYDGRRRQKVFRKHAPKLLSDETSTDDPGREVCRREGALAQVSLLTIEERTVFGFLFLSPDKPTQAEVALELDISQSTVSRLLKSATEKLSASTDLEGS